MKSVNQKLKLLYLMKIFTENTDEEHALTVPQIIDKLRYYDILAERRSIYDDLDCLRRFGLDLCCHKSNAPKYYIGQRDFELPELKLLVDSVQSSRFITKKKSLELIRKIEKLTSKNNAQVLHRQVYVANRAKTSNETVYYNVDKIHEAIARNCQISFKYFDIDVDRNKVYRKDGEHYCESPVALSWDDENYYLITYKEKYDGYTHYRVDKMESISLLDLPRVLAEEQFDLSEYSVRTFSMFGGEEAEVSIKLDNAFAGVIYDRFGTNIPVIKEDDEHFICHVKVSVSDQFLAWVFGLGEHAQIVAPESVVEKMRTLIETVGRKY